MNKIFFTSDLHFGHNKEFLYTPRGFDNIFIHDATIISNWNDAVGKDDIVYILGDLMLRNNDYGMWCIEQLNGHKQVILGNHDSYTRQMLYSHAPFIESIAWADTLRIGKYDFFLCHYPTLTDNFDRYRKQFNLHGHTHSKDKFQFINHCCYNVALDAHDNKPVEIEEIIHDLQQKRQEYNNEQTQAQS